MKALFVRCYGKLTADMMIGGLIDMGVPPVYLSSKLEDAGLSAPFIEKPNPKAQISAHYFHIPEAGEKPMLLKERDVFKLWRDICEKGAPDWEDTGWKVFSALTSGASDAIDEIAGNIIDLRRIGVSEENLISLYLFLACLDYLEVESLFVVPFSIKEGRSERARATLHILTDAGSTVEIVSAPGARPNPAWLNFVVTGKARTHIRHALKLQRRSESISLGERLLNKVLNGFDSALDKIPAERVQAMLTEYRQETIEDLLEDIGLGNRMAYVVARRLLGEGEQLPSPEGPLAIRGTEGLVLSYAKCCTPIPGDPIVGHLSAGKGMVVHLDNCRNISEIRHNPEKCIQLSWAKDVSGEFNVELRVELEHQRGLIALLASSVNAADGNIEKISMDERDGRISVVQLVVSVHDRVHLARVIKKLRALTGVIRITRMRA